MLGGGAQPRLFARVHGLGGGAEIAAGTVANLDKHQGIALLHDEIDLPEGAAVIALGERQALLLQVAAGALLRLTTAVEVCPGILHRLR